MCDLSQTFGELSPMTRRVLIVEDHRDTLRAMVRLLTLDGYEVLPAASVAQAIDQLVLQPDFVITDLMLPDGDGIEVLRRARSRDESIIVAICTAAGDELVQAATAAGPDALFRKPADIGALREWLKTNSTRVGAAEAPAVYAPRTT
jgi:CheY-like chemotaxis protein